MGHHLRVDSQSFQRNLFLKLRIYAITRYSHTPGITYVPLAGIRSIPHPEIEVFDIPIYEISDALGCYILA